MQKDYFWKEKGLQLEGKWSTVGGQKKYILNEKEVF